jgi:predicted nucleotidyltransferase
MSELIEHHRGALAELCQRYQVKTLEVFGSAADGAFDPGRSDLDFLLDFQAMPPGQHSKSYFALWFAVQELFGRHVDLVEIPALTNPYFVESIREARRVLYAA